MNDLHFASLTQPEETTSYRDDVTQLFDAYLTGLSLVTHQRDYIKRQYQYAAARLLELDNKYSRFEMLLDFNFTCVRGNDVKI